ncbi:MAG TPA: c-type cytochrome [Pyrinomonadaceae bacterium]|jgi:cytochrome c oxidase cbb3-type subunit 3
MERRGKQTTALFVSLLLLGAMFASVRLARPAATASASQTARRAATTTASAGQRKLEGERLERARGLFADNCVRCHGADGRGQVPMGRVFNAPNLTDPGWWKKERPTDRRLTNSIRNGRNDERMPGFGHQLSKADIATLVAYVRMFNGK